MIAIMIATAVSTLVSLFGTRYLIVFFQTRGQGQPILGKEDHGPEHHMVKQGTPTMGGIAIVVAAFVGWVVAHVRDLAFSNQTMIVWGGVLFLAAMGFLDDYIKVSRERNLGLNKKAKVIGLLTVAFGFAFLSMYWVKTASAITFTRVGFPDIELVEVLP